MTDLELAIRAQGCRPWVYISGPMTRQPYIGPRDAMAFATRAWRAGWHPILPQLCSLWEMSAGPLDPDSVDGVTGWLEYDFSLLTRCNAIVRLPGVSSGADREIALASALNLKILTMDEVLRGPV